MDTALEKWRSELIDDDNCADKRLLAAATDLKNGNYDSAQRRAADTLTKFPHAKTAYLLDAEIHAILGRHAASAAARHRYEPESGAGGTLHASNHGTIHLIPGASALTLVELGLEELAVRILEEGMEDVHRYDEDVAKAMALSYSEVARLLFKKRRLKEMEQALNLSMRIHPTFAALNVFGTLAYGNGNTVVRHGSLEAIVGNRGQPTPNPRFPGEGEPRRTGRCHVCVSPSGACHAPGFEHGPPAKALACPSKRAFQQAVNRKPYWSLVAVAALILGGAARFHGIDRDRTDFLLPERAALGIGEEFYEFHPDEETLVHAAIQLETPLRPPTTSYGLLPIYLARGIVEALSMAYDADLSELRASPLRPHLFAAVRVFSAGFSMLCLIGLWVLARI